MRYKIATSSPDADIHDHQCWGNRGGQTSTREGLKTEDLEEVERRTDPSERKEETAMNQKIEKKPYVEKDEISFFSFSSRPKSQNL